MLMAKQEAAQSPADLGYDGKVDIWAVGCLVHELLTGDPSMRAACLLTCLTPVMCKQNPAQHVSHQHVCYGIGVAMHMLPTGERWPWPGCQQVSLRQQGGQPCC